MVIFNIFPLATWVTLIRAFPVMPCLVGQQHQDHVFLGVLVDLCQPGLGRRSTDQRRARVDVTHTHNTHSTLETPLPRDLNLLAMIENTK